MAILTSQSENDCHAMSAPIYPAGTEGLPPLIEKSLYRKLSLYDIGIENDEVACAWRY